MAKGKYKKRNRKTRAQKIKAQEARRNPLPKKPKNHYLDDDYLSSKYDYLDDPGPRDRPVDCGDVLLGIFMVLLGVIGLTALFLMLTAPPGLPLCDIERYDDPAWVNQQSTPRPCHLVTPGLWGQFITLD